MRTAAYVMEADVHQGRPEVAAQFPVEDEPGALSVVETEAAAAPDADAAGRFEAICEALRTRGCMLERARYAAEAKPLYEKLHPETRQGAKAGGGKPKPSTVDPFVRYMAKCTQVSATTIKNAVSIGRGLAPTVLDQLWGSKLANATTDLLRLAGVSEAAQKAAVTAFHKPRGGILALRATLDELAPQAPPEDAAISKLRQETQDNPMVRDLVASLSDEKQLGGIDDHTPISEIPALAPHEVLQAFLTMGALREAASQIVNKPTKATSLPLVVPIRLRIGNPDATPVRLREGVVFVRLVRVENEADGQYATVEVSDGQPPPMLQNGNDTTDATRQPSDGGTAVTSEKPFDVESIVTGSPPERSDSPKSLPSRTEIEGLQTVKAGDEEIYALGEMVEGDLDPSLVETPSGTDPLSFFPCGAGRYWDLLRSGVAAAGRLLSPLGFEPGNAMATAAKDDLVVLAYGTRARLLHVAFGWCDGRTGIPEYVYSAVMVEGVRLLVRHRPGDPLQCWVRRAQVTGR